MGVIQRTDDVGSGTTHWYGTKGVQLKKKLCAVLCFADPRSRTWDRTTITMVTALKAVFALGG